MKKFLDEYELDIRRLADEFRAEELPVLTEALFCEFERCGNRLSYENVYFERRKRLSVFGTAACLYRKQEDIAKLEKILTSVCDEICWALPAHVKRKEPGKVTPPHCVRRQVGRRNKIACGDGGSLKERTIDLFAAETAQTLACISRTLSNELSVQLQERIRKEVYERVLEPFMNSEEASYGWERSNDNWNAVCLGCIGCTVLDLMEDEEERLKLLTRIFHGLRYYIEGFGEDGACLEGLHYWTYGFFYYSLFMARILNLTGETLLINSDQEPYEQASYIQTGQDLCRSDQVFCEQVLHLLQSPKLKAIAMFCQKCYFPYGYTVCFADSEPKEKYLMGLMAYLAMQYVDADHCSEIVIPEVSCAARVLETDCYRFAQIYQTVLWGRALEKAMDNGEITVRIGRNTGSARASANVDGGYSGSESLNVSGKYKMDAKPIINASEWNILPDAQWAICQDSREISFVVKGGHNAEPHNHNDVGSFMLFAGEDVIFTDLGRGEYTRDYFSENRYQIFCTSSESHNVPVINGRGQKAGRECCTSFFTADGEGHVELEFAGAYGNDALKRLLRRFTFHPEQGTLEIKDYFELQSIYRVTPPHCVRRQVGRSNKIACGDGGSFKVTPPHCVRRQVGRRNKIACGDGGSLNEESQTAQEAVIPLPDHIADMEKNALSIEETLVTTCPVSCEGTDVILRLKQGFARVEAEGIEGTPVLHERIHVNGEGQEEKVTVIRWNVSTKAEDINCLLKIKIWF